MTLKSKLIHALWAAPLVLALVVWPRFAAAWFENTTVAKFASPGGCFTQFNSFDHHGADTSVRASVTPMGFTAALASQCDAVNAPGITRRIKGMLLASVIKLVRAGGAGQPDVYNTCRIVSSGMTGWRSSISINTALPHPASEGPCGNGFYAQISCLQNATMQITDGVAAFNGTFNAVNIKTDCVFSPTWHGVNLRDGNGQPILSGGPVKL